MIYFTSDLHLSHTNIIKYCNRPFSSTEEMDEIIIENYNKTVSNEDTCYFLGDIIFSRGSEAENKKEKLLGSLRGKKHLIYGNHDRVAGLGRFFVSLQSYSEVKIPGSILGKGSSDQLAVLCHYPLTVWNKSHYGSWNLHGHCHGTLPVDNTKRQLDVGVDCHNFFPISAVRVAEIMSTKVFKPVDNHG